MADNDLSIDEMLGTDPAQVGEVIEGSGIAASPGPSTDKMIAGDAYESADRYSKQTALWNVSHGSADADIIGVKDLIDARANDRLRNDAYIQGADDMHRDSIVGAQYVLNSKPATRVLFGKDDEIWEREFQEEVEEKFRLWANSASNWGDASRVNDFTGLVRLAVGCHLAGGEVVSTAEWMPDDGRPYRTAVQMVDPTRLSDPEDRVLLNTDKLRKGVEIDRYGAPVAYHFRMKHPGDYQVGFTTHRDTYKWRRVMARKPWGRPMVLHVFETKRPEQTRGISMMASSLAEMRMSKTFRDTMLQNAIVQATYAASIESELPPDIAFNALGGGEDVTAPVQQWLGMLREFSGGAKNLKMGGVKIPHLLPGTKLQLRPAGQGGPLGTEFEQSILRYLSAATGLSYEQLSRDYTNTNYSSARAAMGETYRFMQARKKMVADRFANFMYRLWLEEAINKNNIEALKRQNVPSFYEGLNAEAYCDCEWIGAGRGQIDPLKETQAALLRIKGRLSTREHEIALLHGADYRRVARQQARERQLDESLGLPPLDENTQDQENALSGNPAERGDTDER